MTMTRRTFVSATVASGAAGALGLAAPAAAAGGTTTAVPSRRPVERTGKGALTGAERASAGDDPAAREPILVGANPAVQLFDENGACTAYVSCWWVDWSLRGRGTAIVLWRPDGVVVYGADRHLGLWLADHFVRHFPELDGLPWVGPVFRRARARVEIDLGSGLRAEAGDLVVSTREVLDRRTFATDDFPLGDIPHSLSLVLAPCGEGSIRVKGRQLPGRIEVGGTPDRPGSSAFVTEAEVWSAAPGDLR